MAFLPGIDVGDLFNIEFGVGYVSIPTPLIGTTGVDLDGFFDDVEFTSGSYVSSGANTFVDGLDITDCHEPFGLDYGIPYVTNTSKTFTNSVKVITVSKRVYPGDDSVEIVYGNVVAVSFTADPVDGIIPLAVTFTNNSDWPSLLWKWDFGDGHVSYDYSTTHTYPVSGRYLVTLTAYEFSGEELNSSRVLILAYPEPVVWNHVETNRPESDIPNTIATDCTFDSTEPMTLLPEPFNAEDFQESSFIYDTFGFVNEGTGE